MEKRLPFFSIRKILFKKKNFSKNYSEILIFSKNLLFASTTVIIKTSVIKRTINNLLIFIEKSNIL